MTAPSTSDHAFEDQIRRLLHALEAAGHSVLSRNDQELLQSIVDAAAQIFGAAAASIALVDDSQQTLVFQVACGAGKENIIGLSTPLDRGLAGYVVMTGQPISVRNVRQDVRFNQEFANSTGYVPQAILATPLMVGDQVIGVMEVLDKINALSFGMQDMDLLGLFARQAAIAIHQSQQYNRLGKALVDGLRRLVSSDDSPELAQALDNGDRSIEDSLLDIADQYSAISQLGSAEQRACLEVLQVFGRYAQSKRMIY